MVLTAKDRAFLGSLLDVYMEFFCKIDDSAGLIEPTKAIKWETYHVADIEASNDELWAAFTKLESVLLFKLAITYLYLSKGWSVYWNYRVNRSTTLTIWVPDGNIGYYVPETGENSPSYEYVRDFRRRRLSHKLKGCNQLYVTHPTSRPVKKNSYWKSKSWFQKEMERG